MQSMTGYGHGTAFSNGLEFVVELVSFNRRNLDIAFSLPREWQGLERPLGEHVRRKIQRGRVQATVKVERGTEEESVRWDGKRVAQTLSRLAELAEDQGIPFEPDADLLFEIAVAHGQTSQPVPSDRVLSAVSEALKEALEQLTTMRSQEGKALEEDLRKRCGLLSKWLDRVRAESDGLLPHYRQELLRRLEQAGLELDLNDARILKEIALFADRCDISEEITRIDSHLELFRKDLQTNGMIGRKLDFILQEVNREFNTIGSKANHLEITRAVIESKNEIERMREQLQNVE